MTIERQLTTSWPFPYSCVDDRGLLRNLPPPRRPLQKLTPVAPANEWQQPDLYPETTMRPERKTITSNGLQWTVISRNERSTTHEGRHFFACRCKPGKPWHIHEHDRDIATNGSTKVLNRFDGRYWLKTEILSDAVRALVEEKKCQA